MSERGRSEGIILFGAEQFRTGVDDRVTGNCATQVFGRTTASEANKDPEIKGLPGKQSQRVPFLRKGELLVSHTPLQCWHAQAPISTKRVPARMST